MILTQRWPLALWAMQNGSMIEQNQDDTTKVACSTIGRISAGTSVCWVVSLMITQGLIPRERATPQIA